MKSLPLSGIITVIPFPDDDLDRCSAEIKGFADLVLNIANIREMHQFLVVDKDDEGRRSHSHLCNIVETEAPPLSVGGEFRATASAIS